MTNSENLKIDVLEAKRLFFQLRIAEVFGIKNFSLLMGFGCSSLRPADNELEISTMKFLAEEFQTLLAAGDPDAEIRL